MDRRIKERRRALRQDRGRNRLLWLGVVGMVCAAVACWVWLRSSHELVVTSVIAPDTQRVAAADIRTALDGAVGVNLLRVRTDSLAGKLRSIPYVREAHVYRRFPNSLEVRVVEYVPFGRIRDGSGEEWLVSAEGRVLERMTPGSERPAGPAMVPEQEMRPEAGQMLPGIFHGGLELLALLNGSEYWTAAHPVSTLAVDAEGRLTMVLGRGAEVRLGDAVDLEVKLRVAEQVVSTWLASGRSLQYVDVQAWERPVVMPRSD